MALNLNSKAEVVDAVDNKRVWVSLNSSLLHTVNNLRGSFAEAKNHLAE